MDKCKRSRLSLGYES